MQRLISTDPNERNRKRVVLIAEDEVLIRFLIADYLREAGFAVLEVANAHDALAVFGAQATIDLVFSDINMPGEMDGQSLADWLLLFRPRVPVILTSGAGTPVLSSNQGCRRFIPKPYQMLEVEEQIRELLNWPSSSGAVPA